MAYAPNANHQASPFDRGELDHIGQQTGGSQTGSQAQTQHNQAQHRGIYQRTGYNQAGEQEQQDDDTDAKQSLQTKQLDEEEAGKKNGKQRADAPEHGQLGGGANVQTKNQPGVWL